ncbi:uncharacterized protein LOC119667103 [Teleopsis dalmanni]|uniref:uncharacterized protein LOC119667103 n=1 Tax=Teleopsis dalmanni TaxID=139649 RepID=UPI0018CD6353|nr:uncharacterized protein LOC119667103 [Teleopsis dalmanni]XP_037932328.1 uncharacterized protein LOC119667103 [Teleopsis dalmanni]XP_037932335.1 uncharacterized protein LOC119667103 [Teleopsis dalmanni]
MAVQWSRELTEKLIAIYQLHECLWEVNHPKYHDRVERDEAFNTMYELLRADIAGLTVEELKRKVLSVRSQFSKELRIINSSKRSVVGNEKVRTPKLWCFYLLDFLRSSIKSAKTKSSVNESDGSAEIKASDCESDVCEFADEFGEHRIKDEFVEDSEFTDELTSVPTSTSVPTCASIPTTSSQKGKKRKFNIDDDSDMILQESDNKRERKFEWLGEQVVSTLNNMVDQDIILEAITKIQQDIMMFAKRDLMRQKQKVAVQMYRRTR